jgi:Domain of unknown function (DUF4160)
MPTIANFGAYSAKIYYADHPPPHFHVVAAEFGARIEIATLRMIDGRLPLSVQRRVMRWAMENRALLSRRWNEINPTGGRR